MYKLIRYFQGNEKYAMEDNKLFKGNTRRLLLSRVLAMFLVVLLQSNTEALANNKQIEASKFLDRFEGYWLGEGEAGGKKVRDEMQYEWTLDHRFLHMKIRSLEGDTFRAEGYFWYNRTQNRFEFYEFNNGRWPVRIMKGSLNKEKLILEERTNDRHIRIILEWVNDGVLKLTEGYVKGQKFEPFVQETFQRKPSK